ncbi:hypothetical protein BJ165DRAFT_1595989 [Panaeolus papilionaceus]|nr:hypothetical protein BJ165DRAFT_1595989 [Panaeolus papilionaceus]
MIFNPSTILVALLGAAACLASPAAAPEEATLAKRVLLSDINVQAACQEQYNNEYVATAIGQGCYDWQCVFKNYKYGVSMDGYCVRHYGSDAYASCSDNFFGWRCYDRS